MECPEPLEVRTPDRKGLGWLQSRYRRHATARICHKCQLTEKATGTDHTQHRCVTGWSAGPYGKAALRHQVK